MSVWQNFKLALTKWSNFSGRSRRAEFWSFLLITGIVGAIASFWDNSLFERREPFDALVGLFFFIPKLAVGTRRLHDTGRSGWWWLIALTGIGYIVLLIWWAQDSKFGANEYGISPKYAHEDSSYDPLNNDFDDQML